jgi:hypothetical protein
VEIMLVYDWPTEKALRPEYEIERLAHSRFADVVPPDEKRMAGKIDTAPKDASEIRDLEAPDSHDVPPQ